MMSARGIEAEKLLPKAALPAGCDGRTHRVSAPMGRLRDA